MYRRNTRHVEALVTYAASLLLVLVQSAGFALADTYVAAPASTEQDVYTIDAHVISAGAIERAKDTCFRLTSTIGEPAPGHSSSTHYALEGGFTASSALTPHDDIFFDGLEDCSR